MFRNLPQSIIAQAVTFYSQIKAEEHINKEIIYEIYPCSFNIGMIVILYFKTEARTLTNNISQ